MQEQFDLDSFIDIGAESVETPQESTSSLSDIYAPKFKDGKDNVYNALIRPIVNPRNPTQPYLNKIVFYLNDDTLNLNGYYDSKRTLGKTSKCPLWSTYWELYNSKDARLKEKAGNDISKPKSQHYCLAYVIMDAQRPELEGKVVIWRFPKTVADQFDKQLKPSEVQQRMGKGGINPANLYSGKDYYISLKAKGEWNDYTDCGFVDERGALKILTGEKDADGNNKYVEIERGNEEHKKLLSEKVYNENIPVLEDYGFKEWSEDDEHKIKKYVNKLKNGDSVAMSDVSNTSSVDSSVPSEASVSEKPKEQIPLTKEQTGAGVEAQNAQPDTEPSNSSKSEETELLDFINNVQV